MSKIAAIVGRPNVGKSTLFNRLTSTKLAIVHDTSGVTRDRHYGTVEWNGKSFTLIDTGGLVPESDEVFEKAIREQVNIAIEESDLVLFMLNVREGITALDEEIAHILRKSGKATVLISNKSDDPMMIPLSSEFYRLGLGEVYPLSSINGSGTGEMLDSITEKLAENKENSPLEELPKIAILGRPNTGKSTFINQITKQNRSIVSPIPGTTRDPVSVRYNLFQKDFYLVDTAGLRKRQNVDENIEFYSVLRSIRALEEADVCLVMVDANEGITSQDLHIINLVAEKKRGLVILVNKWDCITPKDSNTINGYTTLINDKIKPLSNIPILFISALQKIRLLQVIEKALEVYQNRHQKISTSDLNKKLLPDINNYPPPSNKGKFVKIKYITQLNTKYPVFGFFCNLPQYITENYKRFLENRIRYHFGFEGVIIGIVFKKK